MPRRIRTDITALVMTAMVLGGCAASQSVEVSQTVKPIHTASGAMSGTTDRGARAFLGVPYGAPPVGALRWRPPQSVAPWSGVRAADDYGPSCLQSTPQPFAPYTQEFLAGPPFSEDCLYLNVWTPQVVSSARPVLVWFHGGAFNSGSGAVPIYNGATLAEKGAVVVTVNYRLGVLGFLAHPDLSRESPEQVSGNYGLLDMVAALKWVNANIAAFGGDPNNVTIAGQSAGASAVNDLLVSPSATGLFHRAIAASGSGMGIPAPALGTAEQDGLNLANQAGVTGIGALRAIPGEKLVSLTSRPIDLTADTPMPQYVPVVDGHVLPSSPDDPAAVVDSDVPLLTGFTADEVLPSGDEITPSSFEAMVRRRYGTSADRILSLYPHADAIESGDSQRVLARDRYMASLLIWTAARTHHTTQPVFLYLFDHPYPIPESRTYGAFHTSDVPYSLGTLDTPGRDFTAVDRRLSTSMQDAWLSFMATGDPTGGGGLPWRAYQSGVDEVMRLNESPGPQPGVSSPMRFEALREFVHNGGQLSLF